MKIKTLVLICVFAFSSLLPAQTLIQNIGDELPEELEHIYKNGLAYLAKTQTPKGNWTSITRGKGVGTTSLCVLCFLSHGEDPNFGPYADNVKKGIASIIKAQQKNGMMGSDNYNHAYATLCLAEAYGAVMDPAIGPALEKAVKYIIKLQDKSLKGVWRASTGNDDSSISGTYIVSLLAAKNAGLAIPQKNLDRALSFMASCQSDKGGMGYTAVDGGNNARSSLGVLVFALSRNRKNKVYSKGVEFIIKNPQYKEGNWNFYSYKIYYQSQAYFQSDMTVWNKWNKKEIAIIKKVQTKDGCIDFKGRCDPNTSTAMALLALALNYRYLPIYER